MGQLAIKPQFDFVLVVLSGPDKGAQYKLRGRQVSIGRGQDNDIVIENDPKMSRNHAVVHLQADGIEIVNVSERSNITVDNNETSRAAVENGTVIQIGESKFQFKFVPLNALSEKQGPSGVAQQNSSKSKNHSYRKKSSTNFYILIGIIALLFIALLSSKSAIKTPVIMRTDDIAEKQISDYKKIVADIELQKSQSGQNTRQYEEAQTHFIKGFRDYRKGQYKRAIGSFQACQSLFNTHPQCERYSKLPIKKFDELVKYHMILAQKYKAQNQFDACQASFRNVMGLIGSKDNKIYLEALSGYNACAALEGVRF